MTTMTTRPRAFAFAALAAMFSFGFVSVAEGPTAAARPTIRLAVARPLPKDAPRCTAAQSRSLLAADAGTPPAAARNRPAAWFEANECAPPTVTQIPRAPDEQEDLGTIVGPGAQRFRVRRTSHMLWNGVPGKVVLTPAEKRQYAVAATVAATHVAACCSAVRGPLYRDNKWHCSAWIFTSDFFSFPNDALSWSIYSYVSYCSLAASVYGGVVKANVGGRPYNRAPANWAACAANNDPDASVWPDVRGCWGVMGNVGFYRRWFSGDRSDTSVMSGYSIRHRQVVTDVYNPFLEDQCFLGKISSEFHIHANHVVSWQADLVNTPAGVQWCPWHKEG